MSLEERNELFKTYIETNVAPILVEDGSVEIFPNPIVIPAECDSSLLSGHYQDSNYLPPAWYQELITKKDIEYNYLIIEDITNISKDEQLKFVELLKHRKISSFVLPDNTVIIVLAKTVNKDLINSEIYSLVAHI